MPTATFNDTVIASSEDTTTVEGNHYFPRASVSPEFLRESERSSVCPWKGTAQYYDVVVDGLVAEAAAFYYPEPKEAASEITDHIAFWNGVEVSAS